MKIIETDNFGRDYPDESFLPLPRMTKEHAQRDNTMLGTICPNCYETLGTSLQCRCSREGNVMMFGPVKCSKCGDILGVSGGSLVCRHCKKLEEDRARLEWLRDRKDMTLEERVASLEEMMYDHQRVDHTGYPKKLL